MLNKYNRNSTPNPQKRRNISFTPRLTNLGISTTKLTQQHISALGTETDFKLSKLQELS
jgi:hypothetical protein